MAIRDIRVNGDAALRRKARIVEKFDERLHTLLDDMAETMYDVPGAGLAAPQIGVGRRAVIIDVGEGLIELVNPEIIEFEGSQCDKEGCLSIPDESDYVRRPEFVVVKAQDRHGEEIEIAGDGYVAVALCHELDHLDGILYIDKAVVPTEEELEILRLAREAAEAEKAAELEDLEELEELKELEESSESDADENEVK